MVAVVFYRRPERGRRHKWIWPHVQEVGQPVVGGVHLQRAAVVVGVDLDRHFCHSFRQQFETGKIRYIFYGFRLVSAQAQPLQKLCAAQVFPAVACCPGCGLHVLGRGRDRLRLFLRRSSHGGQLRRFWARRCSPGKIPRHAFNKPLKKVHFVVPVFAMCPLYISSHASSASSPVMVSLPHIATFQASIMASTGSMRSVCISLSIFVSP